MLQFIFGKSATGKSYTIFSKIASAVLEDKPCVLIVPEQFTFESEREALRVLGDKNAQKCTVLSFTRLFETVANEVGGTASKVLTEADRIIFMSRVLKNVAGELILWKRFVNSVNFAKTILDTVTEFKIYSITPEQIRNTADTLTASTLKNKLLDIATIYEAFDLAISERYIDPTDMLTLLYKNLEGFRFFNGKTVFFDSFKGFTGQQYKIIERILSQATDVYMAFTNDYNNKLALNVFSNITRAAEKIKAIAEKYNIKTEYLILDKTRYNFQGLTKLENLLSSDVKGKLDDDSVNIVCCPTIYDEADFAAKTIRKLVRTKNYRYKDFVIIARDANRYREAVVSACKKNSVNLFFDNTMPLKAFPLSVAAVAAINSLNFSSENILRFHKTGLGTLSNDEISILENYVFVWGIEGDNWHKNWSMNVNGLVAEEIDNNSLELERINELRKKAIEPLIEFKNEFHTNAKTMTTALVKLFDRCESSKKLAGFADSLKQSDTFTYDALKQSHSELMSILNSIVESYGQSKISKQEYLDTLNLALSLNSIGVVPQSLDEVTFGSADRIRPSRPKVALILGANQGVFPKTCLNNTLLNPIERKNLLKCGIEISDNSVFASIDEDFLVYVSLCCPSDRLYISYFENGSGSEIAEPSVFVQKIIKNLSISPLKYPQTTLTADNLPETESSAFSEFCLADDGSEKKETIRQGLLKSAPDKIKYLSDLSFQKELSSASARALYGKNIYMSASKFDVFNRCRFSYFCKYGLNINRLQKAEFNAMQKGTLVHYVLEKLIENDLKADSSLSIADLSALTDKYINQYLDSIEGYRSIENERLKFIVARITRSLKEVVYHIAAELEQSDFVPVACELKIKKDGDISAVEFPFDDGKIVVTGSIDRVDNYNGYIRIIDYKTGHKNFKLPDILFGLNMQMLIYLYAVTRWSKKPDLSAAGILYQPSSRDLNSGSLAMNGLLCEDELLVKSMDKQGMGQFVPKLVYTKDGRLSKNCKSFVDGNNFSEIFDYIEMLMRDTGNALISGDISVNPLDGRESQACKYCEFKALCQIENTEIPRVPEYDNDEVIDLLKEANQNGVKVNRTAKSGS